MNDIQIEMQNMNQNDYDNENGNKICTLPCGHRFHFRCISQWMLREKICPMCREKMEIDIPDINLVKTENL